MHDDLDASGNFICALVGPRHPAPPRIDPMSGRIMQTTASSPGEAAERALSHLRLSAFEGDTLVVTRLHGPNPRKVGQVFVYPLTVETVTTVKVSFA